MRIITFFQNALPCLIVTYSSGLTHLCASPFYIFEDHSFAQDSETYETFQDDVHVQKVFPLTRIVGRCKKCMKLDNDARLRNDFTKIRAMMLQLRHSEEAYDDGSRVAFTIQVSKRILRYTSTGEYEILQCILRPHRV